MFILSNIILFIILFSYDLADAALRRRGERKDRSDEFKSSQDPNSDMQSKKDDHKKQDTDLDIPMPAGNLPGFIPLPETNMAPPPVSQPATPMPPPPLGLLPPPFALPPRKTALLFYLICYFYLIY